VKTRPDRTAGNSSFLTAAPLAASSAAGSLSLTDEGQLLTLAGYVRGSPQMRDDGI
jgi:hypothetical protein